MPTRDDAVPARDVEPPAGGAAARRAHAISAGPARDDLEPLRDSAWFDELFRTHARSVVRYFARRAAPSDVEDLAAEVLTVAWRRRRDVPEGGELPWLYRTSAFVLANHRRKARPVPIEDGWDGMDDTDPADLAVADDQARRALASLSSRDRQVLLLHAWDGLDGDDLAAVLGISRGGADAALSRARARLRAAWAALA